MIKIKISDYHDFKSGSGKRGKWSVCKAKISFGKNDSFVTTIWDAEDWISNIPEGKEYEVNSIEDGFSFETKEWNQKLYTDITTRFENWKEITGDGGSGSTPTGPAFASSGEIDTPKNPFDDPNITKNLFNGKLKD